MERRFPARSPRPARLLDGPWETYVLGIGPDASNLDPIAVAGGTFHAYAAFGNDAIASTLVTIGAVMRRCHFFFPMVLPPSALSLVSMGVDDGAGGREGCPPRVDDGSYCKDEQGWFYNSPLVPAYAMFCPATCRILLERIDREVTAQVACF